MSETDAERGRRPRLAGEERRVQILRAAEETFAQNGFKATTIDQVAKAARIDRALVYRHFGSKKKLHEACIADALIELRTRVDAVSAVTETMDLIDPLEVTKVGLRAFFEFVEERPHAWDVVYGAGFITPGGITDLARAMIDWVTGYLRHAAPDWDKAKLDAIAVMLIAGTQSVTLVWRHDQSMTIEQLIDHQAAVILSILEPLLASRP